MKKRSWRVGTCWVTASNPHPVRTTIWRARYRHVLIWTRVAHRFGAWGSLTVAYVVQAAGIFAALLGRPAAALASALSYGFTFIGITGVSIALAAGLQPGATARATALITIGYGIGQVVGPWAAGHLATSGGGFGLPLIGAGAVVAASARLSAVGPVVATRAARG